MKIIAYWYNGNRWYKKQSICNDIHDVMAFAGCCCERGYSEVVDIQATDKPELVDMAHGVVAAMMTSRQKQGISSLQEAEEIYQRERYNFAPPRKITNFRLPGITRQQIESIQSKHGYATATEVVIVAVDRMAEQAEGIVIIPGPPTVTKIIHGSTGEDITRKVWDSIKDNSK